MSIVRSECVFINIINNPRMTITIDRRKGSFEGLVIILGNDNGETSIAVKKEYKEHLESLAKFAHCLTKEIERLKDNLESTSEVGG